MREAILPEQFIHSKTDRHRAGSPHSFFCIFNQLSKKPYAVFQAPAIFIGPIVVALQNELDSCGHAMTRIAVNNIEPCLLCSQRGFPMPLAHVANILLVHTAGLYWVI